MFPIRRIEWWYWLGSLILLSVGLGGHEIGWLLLIELCCVQIAHFGWRERTLISLAVQVRVVYLELLLVGLWEPVSAMHWALLAGTVWAVFAGTCPIAWLMCMMPWNACLPPNATEASRKLPCHDT